MQAGEPIAPGQTVPVRVLVWPAVFMGAAGLIGAISWGHEAGWLCVISLLLPVLWAAARNRLVSGLILVAYCLAAARGLPGGAMTYFDAGVWAGIGWWLLGGVCWFLAGVLFWFRQRRIRLYTAPLLLLWLVLPPAGLAGWGNPLLAAGWLFPGWGWFGLLVVVVLIGLLVRLPVIWSVGLVAGLTVWSGFSAIPVQSPAGWYPQHTHFVLSGADTGRDLLAEFNNMQTLQRQIGQSPAGVHWTGEGVGGIWNKAAETSWLNWARQHPDHMVLLGVYTEAAASYANAIIKIRPGESRVIYRQRLPVPGVLWKPWEHKSFGVTLNDVERNKERTINGKDAAFLICYETLMVWPVLQSFLSDSKTDVLLANGSVWWAPDSIRLTMQQSVRSWARLFNVQLLEAWNR